MVCVAGQRQKRVRELVAVLLLPVCAMARSFVEERSRSKEAALEKLDLKCDAVRASVARLESQLARKEEAGESLSTVDFEQLKIQNAQHLQVRNALGGLIEPPVCTDPCGASPLPPV